MHDPPHAGLLAGGEQRGGAVARARRGGIARAVLQHAGAVDDRIDAGQMRQPVCGPRRLGDVEDDASARTGEAAGRAALRATAATSCPSLRSPASTAEPIRPVAPVSSTRKWPSVRQQRAARCHTGACPRYPAIRAGLKSRAADSGDPQMKSYRLECKVEAEA